MNSTAQLPVLDELQLDSLRLSLEPAALKAALQAFVSRCPGQLGAILESSKRGDLFLVRDEARAFKAFAADFGALRLEQVALQIETACTSGDRKLVSSQCKGLAAAAEEAIRAVMAHAGIS